MVVREGYKQTEVGVIPIDWTIDKLGESFIFKNGLNKEKEFFGHGTPIINYMDVYKNTGLKSTNIFGKVEVTKNEKLAYAVKIGDVFFTRTSETMDEIGMSAVVLEEMEDTVYSGFVLRARAINENYDLNFKQYCFISKFVRQQIMSTSSYTTRALTNGRLLSNILVPLPPKPEQKAIAQALSDVDALIESLEQLIDKKRHIKQGAMQELLTGKRRLPGFSGEWNLIKLGDVARMQSGGTPSTAISSYYNGPIQWISISDMTKAGKYIGESEKTITEEGLHNSSARTFPKGTLLLAMYASIGKCSIALNELSTSQAILGIEAKDSINIEYLYYFLLHTKAQLISQGQQGTQSNLNKKIVEGFMLQLPTIEEQKAIATILSDMDSEIEALYAKLKKTKHLKEGMMHELLTGRIRLV